MRKLRPPSRVGAFRNPKLDWRAYFLAFCQFHGEPVEHNGRLLFADGWTYSLTDHSGPEWPPPEDLRELDILVTTYYLILERSLRVTLDKLIAARKSFDTVALSKSMPLQQVAFEEYERDGETRVRKAAKQLDTGSLDARIEWMRQDLAECQERLKELAEHGEAA